MLAKADLQTDWLSIYLFESPWLIIVGLAILWTLMRIISRRKDSKLLRRATWLPLILIVLLWATAALVTTRREKLLDTLDAMLLSIEDKDDQTFHQIVPEDAVALFPPRPVASTYTRDQIEARLNDFEVRDLLLLQAQAALIGESEAVTVIVVRANGTVMGVAGLQKFTWSITWRYVGDRWEAYDFECLHIGFDSANKDKPKQ